MDKTLISKLSNFTLLYAEDEKGIQNNIHEILDCMFKDIYLASNGDSAYNIYEDKKPDLIITDIKMPKLNGIELIKKIRLRDSKTRVIITSAHTNLEYMLDASELHLVKYIVKPITEEKLTQALESFISSYEGSKLFPFFTKWLYDESKSLITNEDEEFMLTKKENIFFKLLLQKDRIITYDEIDAILWDKESVMTQNALRLFTKNLRKKLPKDCLKNVQGIGYRLVL